MKTMLKFLSLAAVLAASAPVAIATPLTPGALAGPAGLTTSAQYNTGTVVAQTGPTDDSFSAFTFNGTFVETVYKNALGDTVGGCTVTSGCLTYVFTFTNDPLGKIDSNGNLPAGKSADAILLATMANFTGYTIAADYVKGSGAAAPVSVSLNMFGTVNYNFDTSGVAPGKTSDTLVLYTNATTDAGGYFGVADGSNDSEVDFGPGKTGKPNAGAVPEPGSLFLLGTGLVTTVGMARRKFKA